MRGWLLLILLAVSLNVLGQSEFIPRLWVPQKTDSTWVLFTPEDSLQEPIRVDSVVISSFSDLMEMALITIDKGKYGIFSTFTESHEQFKHEYDSMFVHQESLLFKKNDVWQLRVVSELFGEQPPVKKLSSKSIGSVDSFFVNKEGVFYWRNGLQGLISGNIVIEPKYAFVRSYSSYYESPEFLVSDGTNVGLLKGEKEVIPAEYEAIEHYKEGWFRFWIRESDTAGYWNYLSPDNRMISTNGFDFRVYSKDVYKQYNSDRSNARIYLKHQELNFGYDDYFLMKGDLLAVKKNGKIGMINTFGKVFFEPKFDQIEVLASNRLRVLKDKAWYLADFSGEIQSETGFGAIMYFQTDDEFWFGIPDSVSYFAINTLKGMGVMNNQGKVIIAPNYSKISRIGAFFIANNGTNVVYNQFGKRVSNKIYSHFSRSFNEFIVMRTADGNFDILSPEGKVNNLPFERFVKYNGAFKCYGKSAMELIVMSDSIPEHVEEIQRFTLDNTVAIEKLDSLHYWSNLWTVQKSELEETQQTGFWNLRETETAFLRQMNWVDVLHDKLNGHSVFAVSNYRPHQVKIPFGPEMSVYFDGCIVNYSNATNRFTKVISSTETKRLYNARSSWDNLEIHPDGSQRWCQPTSNNSNIDANRVFDVNHCLYFGFAATLANEVEWKTDPENDFDLFGWWSSKNDFTNLHPTSSTLPLVMNPKLKMVPDETSILLRSEPRTSDSKASDYLNDNTYDEFVALSNFWSSDRHMFLAKQPGSDTVLWFNLIKDSAVIKDYSSVKVKSNEFAITESIAKHYGYVHPSEPEFVFDPSDTNNWNKQYVYGRILEKKGSETQLKNVDGEVLYSTSFPIKVLDNGLFYITESQSTKLIDRNGDERQTLISGNLSALPNGNYLLLAADSVYWYSTDFHKKSSALSGKLSSVLENCWLIERGVERAVYDSDGQLLTLLEENEKLSENGWLVTKTKSGFSYRFPVTNKELSFRARPEERKNMLLKKEGNFYSVYGLNGNEILSRSKHMESKRERGQFTVFTGKKAFMVFDQSGTNVFKGTNLKSAEELDGILFVETKDTVFEVRSSDLELNTSKSASENVNNWKIGAESIVLLPAKQGAAFYYGKCIIPAVYDKVIPAGNQFFVVQSGEIFLSYQIGVGFVKRPNFN